MITQAQFDAARDFAWKLVKQSGVLLREEEIANIEVADLGLSEFDITGATILTLASTDWIGVKLLVLTPNQFFPQHRHPPSQSSDYSGKQEIFRGQWGELYLYEPGDPTPNPKAQPPEHRRPHLTSWCETILHPAEQHISPPNTWHWFQAGAEGAVCWSFSSKVTDSDDQFIDPDITRKTVIGDSNQ